MCCTPTNGIGVTVNCNSNCNRWCPRVLRVFCCCFGCTGQRETSDCEERVERAKSEALREFEKRDRDKNVKADLKPKRVKKKHHYKKSPHKSRI